MSGKDHVFIDGVRKNVAVSIDWLAMAVLNARLPATFAASYQQTPTFEKVLEGTRIDRRRTVTYQLTAPGEHPVFLNTLEGALVCHVRVMPAADPAAPLLLFHHGFNELPYTASWRRIFDSGHQQMAAHLVCVQAPFHDSWQAPMREGFASLQRVYQIFAGSLRIMELMQARFEEEGVVHTDLVGLSWGGITSLLYEGVFGSSRAVIPLLSSPNLAQVLWDFATLFNRPVNIAMETLSGLLDFTPYYERCTPDKVFPIMAEEDQFFRYDHHAAIFGQAPPATIPAGHITAHWQAELLRNHILNVLADAPGSVNG